MRPALSFALPLLALCFFCTCSFGAEFPELQWLHSSSDRLQHLSASPAECLDLSGNAEELYAIEVGRQAFRSPALLGGQASRVGLSCQGCHINGHDHPAFFIEGSSGQSGTVDVTTAVFSEVRGDSVHNPVPIPSLVNVSQKQSFGTNKLQTSLANFVQGLVVEEFMGEEPSVELLSALVSYLEALSSSACAIKPTTLNNLDEQLLNILRSVDVLDQAYEKGDIELADFLVMTTQHELSVLYQRFAIDETLGLAQEIVSRSRQLGGFREMTANNSRQYLRAWAKQWQSFSTELRAQESDSLYRRDELENWLLSHP